MSTIDRSSSVRQMPAFDTGGVDTDYEDEFGRRDEGNIVGMRAESFNALDRVQSEMCYATVWFRASRSREPHRMHRRSGLALTTQVFWQGRSERRRSEHEVMSQTVMNTRRRVGWLVVQTTEEVNCRASV